MAFTCKDKDWDVGIEIRMEREFLRDGADREKYACAT